MCISSGSFGIITAGSQVKLPHTGSNDQQVPVFLSVPDGGLVLLVMSSSAMGEAVWVVVSIKSCSSTGSDSMQLNRVLWGHQLMDPRWITPKLWTTSQ